MVLRALADVGLCEIPPGSNRSPTIDEYNRRAGAVAGSYWCASALFCWAQDCGLWTPPRGLAPSCDEWVKAAQREGRWTFAPRVGYAVFYHSPSNQLDAVHCGLVVRTVPLEFSVEGNTSIGGSTVTRNGVAVGLKMVNSVRLMGYVKLI